MSEKELAESEMPQGPLDSWATDLYKKHGLGEAPTLKDIEPIATGLLENPRTIIEAAELVLGRRVDAQELSAGTCLGQLLTPGNLSPDQKLSVLYLIHKIERLEREQASQQL